MKIGFTGTRKGLTADQLEVVRILLQGHASGDNEFHHGDCVGADEQAAKLARIFRFKIVSHPPADDKLRAHFPSDEVRDPLPYLERNRAIVDEVDFVIGAPGEVTEQLRSGTWSTIRYARGLCKDVQVVSP